MPDIFLIKTNGVLIPATNEAIAQVESLKEGEMYLAKVTLKRNGKFFRKWMKLLEYAFDLFEESRPEVVIGGRVVKPNFRRFRHDVTIMAGFCEPVISASGEIKYIPEDVSFNRMSEERFAHLYDATLDALIEKVLHGKGLTREKLDEAVNNLLKFA